MSAESPTENGDVDEGVWNYLNHRVLTRLDEEQEDWRHVTSGQFSKLPCIADRKLKDEHDIDIHFPRYWYQFGEVGNRFPIDSRLFIIEEKQWGKSIRPARATVEFDIAEDIREAIDIVVEEVVERFANREIEVVKSHQYSEYAPNEFIQKFESLRQDVYDIAEAVDDDGGIDVADRVREDLHAQLEDLVVEYEDELYENMQEDFLIWEDTMNMLISRGEFGRLEANFEEFWDVFSKVHLRIEHNNFLISRQLENWQAENEQELEKYRRGISQLREELLDESESSEILTPISSSYSETVRTLIDG